ncbi:MAG: pyridoxal-phosphate dependent enzyme, partial [Planctomycetota bacterium]
MNKINIPPRIALRPNLPTPIERLDRLFPNHQVYCKREDLTGTLLSGNKVRKLEFCLHEALEQKADTLLTVGGIQSNHARCTAAVAAMLGMKSVLLLREGENQNKPEGNYLLDRLLGSEIHWISKKEYKNHPQRLTQLSQQLTQQGRYPYIVAEGGSSALGSLGYVLVMEELMQQAEPFDYIVTAVGSGGTFAGLYAGAKLFSPETQVIGINVYLDTVYFQNRCFQLLQEIAEKYQTPSPE